MEINNIIIAGIGGQGTVLSSRLIAAAAMRAGEFVRTAETIGMAQRGGSVTSHVRINSRLAASMIPPAGAELLIAFDKTEAVRAAHFLKEGGLALINSTDKEPPSSLKDAVMFDGTGAAMNAGSVKTLNVAMLGAAERYGMLPFDCNAMLAAINEMIPEKYREMNIKAFGNGRCGK